MLNWIGGGKVDHPMADAKQARQIVAELPASDAARALQEVTELLESINATEGFKLERRLDNIDLLDGAAKNHQRKLSQDYLAMPRQQKFQENKLWTAVSGFWRALGDGYIHCIDQYEAGASGASGIKKNLPAVVARALRVLTLQLKWLLLRYGPVAPHLWSQLARLYQLAEKRGFGEGKVVVYPGAHGESTIRHEFLKSLMLAASSTDGLPPLKQQIAERVVAQFAHSFVLSRKPEGCTYYFDLAEPKPPARLMPGATPGANVVYFGAGAGLQELQQLTEEVVKSGAVPKDINLGGAYEKDLVITTLRHLLVYWSDKPPARGSERRKTASRLTVVPGLNEILGMIDPANSDALDFSQDAGQSAESWIVENVSEGGFGAIIPALKSDWIKVGTLIGLQSEGKTQWGIGMIRRISRDEHQQRRVGIQLLSKTAIPVKLARSGTVSSFNAGREPGGAILLSTTPDSHGEVGVVMREGIFNGRDSLEMMVRDKAYLLMPAKMVEGGEDFDWARFKVMQRAG